MRLNLPHALSHDLALSLAHATLAVIFAFALASARASAHSRGPQQQGTAAPEEKPKPSANTVVYGRAVFAKSGRAVRRARVHLVKAEAGAVGRGRAGLTDANGRFRIENVEAGSYIIYVESPGLLTPTSFTDFDAAAARQVLNDWYRYFDEVTVDGKANKEVEVRARLGAAISGKVTYADGSPAPGAQVSVMLRKVGRDMRVAARPGGVSTVQTDERGRYRLSALPPGDYIVAVSELIAHGGSEEQTTASPLVLTYHPSETRAEKAEAVSVGAGEEREDVDITVAERETHAVSGVVRGRRDGMPVVGATVEFSSKEYDSGAYVSSYARYSSGPNVTLTDEQGRWHFDEMPDGDYLMDVSPPGELVEGDAGDLAEDEAHNQKMLKPAPPKKNYAPAHFAVTVAGNDVSDLSIVLGDAGRITGTITVEGGAPLPDNKYVFAMQTEGRAERPFFAQAAIAENEFTIEELPPGRYILQTGTLEIGSNDDTFLSSRGSFFVKSITWRGRDLMREQLELKEGESADGVRIVFSAGSASLRLRVSSGPDKMPVRGIYVVLTSTDPAQRYRTDLPYCFTDREGVCTMSGAPGEYAVIAFRGEDRPNFYDEKETERLAAAAPRVTLVAGKPGTFDLSLPAGH